MPATSSPQNFLRRLVICPIDFVMANPPFHIKESWDAKLEGDVRWKYGTPPQGDANSAWVQHMHHHLAPNGSMSSNSSGEGDIRRALIEADLVECMVSRFSDHINWLEGGYLN